MYKYLMFIATAILFTSCLAYREKTREYEAMIRLLKEKKMTYAKLNDMLSDDHQCSYQYLVKNQISCPMLQQKYSDSNGSSSNGTDSSCTRCATVDFCSIEKKDLIINVKNYRDNIWANASGFNGSTPLNGVDYTNYATNAVMPSSWGTGHINPDAQFMDIKISDMKNYLCVLDNSIIPNGIRPNTLRLYYTRYDNMGNPPPGYLGKHTLCVVPVERDLVSYTTIPNGEVLDKVEFNGATFPLIWNISDASCNSHTAMFNRNMLCPPNTGCLANTLLTILP